MFGDGLLDWHVARALVPAGKRVPSKEKDVKEHHSQPKGIMVGGTHHGTE
jgi:hypothetical protein